MGSVATMTPDQLERSKALLWDNEHSRRIAGEVGDPSIAVAWDGPARAWAVARWCQVRVMTPDGIFVGFERAPLIWSHLREDDGQAVAITDPGVVPYIQRCDGWAQQGGRAKAVEMIQRQRRDREWRRQSRQREMLALNRDAYKRALPILESMVSSAPRENGTRKHFYAGCLDQTGAGSWKPTAGGILLAS